MKPRIGLFAVAAASLLAGCGSGDETRSFKLVRVTGVITHNGKPLPDAEVVFIPDRSNDPATDGSDVTGADGNYMLRYRGRTGVAPGKYQVKVTKKAQTPGTGGMVDDPYMAALARESRGQSEKQAKAAMIEGSFNADVSASGGEFKFDIKGR